jgi:hypothetical protein
MLLKNTVTSDDDGRLIATSSRTPDLDMSITCAGRKAEAVWTRAGIALQGNRGSRRRSADSGDGCVGGGTAEMQGRSGSVI